MVQDRCLSSLRWARTLVSFGTLSLPSWCSSSDVRWVSWVMAANRWGVVQVSCTLQRLSCVRWWLRGNRKFMFFNGVEQLVMDSRCSRRNTFSSSIHSALQSSNRSASRAGSQVDSCFRCFLLLEHTVTLPTFLWARLHQNVLLYRENCRSTTLKPRQCGWDLSSRCLKCEQVHRMLILSLQDRKPNTCSHNSPGSCSADIIASAALITTWTESIIGCFRCLITRTVTLGLFLLLPGAVVSRECVSRERSHSDHDSWLRNMELLQGGCSVGKCWFHLHLMK